MTQLELDRPRVEFAIGRPLRLAEQAIDVVLLDAALNAAKDELERTIRDEMIRAALRYNRTGLYPALTLTPAMRRPLERLHDLGRDEAVAELERAGYTGVRTGKRQYAWPGARDPRAGRGMDAVFDAIRHSLPSLTVLIHDKLVVTDLSNASAAAIAQALFEIPGARDIASRVVSTALYSGMGATFEENAHLVDGWERTAVLDAGTCDPCAAGDGKRFRSWEEAQAEMPNGGPAVDCQGGGRCRCRLVPAPAP